MPPGALAMYSRRSALTAGQKLFVRKIRRKINQHVGMLFVRERSCRITADLKDRDTRDSGSRKLKFAPLTAHHVRLFSPGCPTAAFWLKLRIFQVECYLHFCTNSCKFLEKCLFSMQLHESWHHIYKMMTKCFYIWKCTSVASRLGCCQQSGRKIAFWLKTRLLWCVFHTRYRFFEWIAVRRTSTDQRRGNRIPCQTLPRQTPPAHSPDNSNCFDLRIDSKLFKQAHGILLPELLKTGSTKAGFSPR